MIAANVIEILLQLPRLTILRTQREAVLETQKRRGQQIAQFRAPVVGVLVNDRKAQWMIEVLVVELRKPIKRLAVGERHGHRERTAVVVEIARLVSRYGIGIALAGIAFELVTRERARQVLIATNVVEVEAQSCTPRQLVSETGIGTSAG